MKFSIVTPTYNRSKYLDETIRSVVSQHGDFEIEYIIQDGGSHNSLVGILDAWDRRVKAGDFDLRCRNVSFSYYMEPDNGMYDAIAKGFKKSTGDIMAWINSDDMYHPCAFQTVAQVLSRYDDILWLTGIPNSYNHDGLRTGFDNHPDAYSREYIKSGFYDVNYRHYGFNWIQQESTFWRRALWDFAGGIDSSLRYAADFYLWQQFARHAELVRVQSFLGGYRVHNDQITANPALYREELPLRQRPPFGLKIINLTFKVLPPARQLFFNPVRGMTLLPLLGLKFEHMVGRVIEWSYPKNDWVVRVKSIL